MLRIAFCAATVLAVLGTGSTARGQWFDPRCCEAPVCPQVCQACAPPPVMVQQQCYQTIPVTEYKEVRQTVQRPVIETAYVDQPVTEYRQVMETKVAQVPTCQYQTVTEYRQVQRDLGCWTTQYQCNPRLQPCQYDARPNLFGFLNRTGYQMRMAFTPPMTATRTWKPNVVVTQVPVQRQVAIRGTQQVNYQVARMVPYTTTRKVAVNTVKMVNQEVVMKQPVTVYKTVPAGTATVLANPGFGTAWGNPAFGTAFGGTIINGSSTATALQPTPIDQNQYKATGTATAVLPRDATPKSSSERQNLPDALKDDELVPTPTPAGRPSGAVTPRDKQEVAGMGDDYELVEVVARKAVLPSAFASRPTIARVSRWVARRSTDTPQAPKPELVADNSK